MMELLSKFVFANYPKTSRIHRLKSFDTSSCRSFVKREDELGFGISGYKVRKYLSLLPYLLSEKIQEAVLVGSVFSNHILSLSQLLKENGITPVLFLVGEIPKEKIGNFLLTSLLVEEEKMHFFLKTPSSEIKKFAEDYVIKRQKEDIRCLLIPMGASMPQALPGALTLAEDVLSNEKDTGVEFDHIFLDAGTGMMAASLILAFGYLKKKTCFHVILVAGTPEEFESALEQWKKEWESLFGVKCDAPLSYFLYQPNSAKSFGSVNSAVFTTIKNIAREEGFFTDPIFTAKLFQKGKEILLEKNLQGEVLFIHSGGSLSLMGFQEELAKKCSSLMEVNEIYKIKSSIH